MTNEQDDPKPAAGTPTGSVLFYTVALLEHFRNPRNVGELAEGKPVEEARRITDDDVIEALGGIPENRKHCSLLGVQAFLVALEDWEGRQAAKAARP